jgi:hypothetical protein
MEFAPRDRVRYHGTLAEFEAYERESEIERNGRVVQAARIKYLEGDGQDLSDVVATVDLTRA